MLAKIKTYISLILLEFIQFKINTRKFNFFYFYHFYREYIVVFLIKISINYTYFFVRRMTF